MKLYLLKIKNLKDYGGYHSYESCIVRADTEEQARSLAFVNLPGWQRGLWLDPGVVSCQELSLEGNPEIVIVSFNLG